MYYQYILNHQKIKNILKFIIGGDKNGPKSKKRTWPDAKRQ